MDKHNYRQRTANSLSKEGYTRYMHPYRAQHAGNIVPITMIASAFIGFATFIGFLILPLSTAPMADMRIEPNGKTVVAGDSFTVSIIVESAVPVNVFAGELLFDTTTLEVTSIDYNTSIADLWAEEPWYSNGEGTLTFIGGTTRPGGFIGTDTLITVTFSAKTVGGGSFLISDATILQHDGLGSEATLAEPIDALFTITNDATSTTAVLENNLIQAVRMGTPYNVVNALPSTDLNGDGKQTIADTSTLLLHLGSSDMRYDLNGDGVVNFTDFNIVLTAQ